MYPTCQQDGYIEFECEEALGSNRQQYVRGTYNEETGRFTPKTALELRRTCREHESRNFTQGFFDNADQGKKVCWKKPAPVTMKQPGLITVGSMQLLWEST